MASAPGLGFDGAAYLAEVRELVIERIERFVPSNTRYQRELYDLVLDYPLRPAKGLRPALCVAACRALGGDLEAVLPTAAVLELYHNAFLVHDDVEDGSERRRGERTLQHAHGTAVAVNVGDAMLALTLGPLLDNTRLIGLGGALRVLDEIRQMAMHSVEGQALELHWVQGAEGAISADQYLEMVEKKTAYYSFVAPLRCGAIIAEAGAQPLGGLTQFARALGIAFQIQDDLLNLDEQSTSYGKEFAGDLWEGKYTLILIEALARASAQERRQMRAVLRKPRPGGDARRRAAKTSDDVALLQHCIQKYAAKERARDVARQWAGRAERCFQRACEQIPHSRHRDLLGWLVEYTVERAR